MIKTAIAAAAIAAGAVAFAAKPATKPAETQPEKLPPLNISKGELRGSKGHIDEITIIEVLGADSAYVECTVRVVGGTDSRRFIVRGFSMADKKPKDVFKIDADVKITKLERHGNYEEFVAEPLKPATTSPATQPQTKPAK